MNLFKEALKATGQQVHKKNPIPTHLLITVQRFERSTADKDLFRVTGLRHDTGELVAVYSKKSAGGQKIPGIGDIFRADKAVASAMNGDMTDAEGKKVSVQVFEAPYFHSYAKEDLCLSGVVRTSKPTQGSTGQWQASVTLFDTEVQSVVLTDAKNFEKEVLRLLKPWEMEAPSSITQDAVGRKIWGSDYAQGASPQIIIRQPGSDAIAEHRWIFGLGGVNAGTKEQPSYRYPTDQEILEHIKKPVMVGNKSTPSNFTMLSGLMAQIEENPEMKKGFIEGNGLTLVPAVKFPVGRDSLAENTEKYLAVKQAFVETDDANKDQNGNPKESRMFRPAILHIKESSTGRYIVVDAVPAAGKSTKGLPQTAQEKAILAPAASEKAGQHERADNAQRDQASTKGTHQPANASDQSYYETPADDLDFEDDAALLESLGIDDAPSHPLEDMTSMIEDAERRAAARAVPRM